ncbi:MAG: hypothetical protein ACR2QT_06795 [Woeseiaceae bacterium]
MRLETSAAASLQLHAIETLASKTAVERVREQLIDVLTHRMPVAVTVTGFGTVPEATFGAVCGVLRSAVDVAGVNAAHISVAVDAMLLSPTQLYVLRNELLGPGPLYLLIGSALAAPATNAKTRRQQDNFWLQCWQLRNREQLRIALAPMISSSCPLLPPETAYGILPPSGLQVPPGTAWVQMPLQLTDYTISGGDLDEDALHEDLRRCIRRGETLHDEADWPTAAMRHDAWLNRRLAISINGIGDLAELRGLDPACFDALQYLSRVLADVREVVVATSRQLALQTQPTPSLAMIKPGRSDAWQARWERALQFSAMRHRNLLTLSPWAVFPSAATADSRYSDLLPLLKYSDTCAFPAPPSLLGWNFNEFKDFHHRLSAVLDTKGARQLIAEQV